MRLIPSDPDLKTVVARIQSGDLDLQPDFQRGEVWSETKKRRLIDSILRDWHVPPIHVIEVDEGQVVLDGQQRLAAIRDFVDGDIRVDGDIEPYDEKISALDGLSYGELPPSWRRRFDQFTIRVIRITDYDPDEPGELFYRLNQPTSLTSAEQRNAFFGPVRRQIKMLVTALENNGIDSQFIGFSNSRMAYDDVLARVCVAIENKSIKQRITSTSLANWYRSEAPFSDFTIKTCLRAIRILGECRNFIGGSIRFNKASLFSWLWFFGDATGDALHFGTKEIGQFFGMFEEIRISREPALEHYRFELPGFGSLRDDFIGDAMRMYIDRSSSRVADVFSVVASDAIIWILYLASYFGDKVYFTSRESKLESLRHALLEAQLPSSEIDVYVLVDVLVNDPMWGVI